MTASAGTLTLSEFLTARLDEDEAYGLALAHGNRSGLERPGFGIYNPARVLAEVAAKRAIVEIHSPEVHHYGFQREKIGHHCSPCSDSDYGLEEWPCDTIRALASVYSDRPDWREEWAL